jgi:hypothetical protein
MNSNGFCSNRLYLAETTDIKLANFTMKDRDRAKKLQMTASYKLTKVKMRKKRNKQRPYLSHTSQAQPPT